MEKEQAPANGVSYLDCFKGTDLRRTEIVCMTWIAQTMCGSSLGGLQSCTSSPSTISLHSAYAMQSSTKPPVSPPPTHLISASARLPSGLSGTSPLGSSVCSSRSSLAIAYIQCSRTSRSSSAIARGHDDHLRLPHVCHLALT